MRCPVPLNQLAGDTAGLAAVLPMVNGYVNDAFYQEDLAEADRRWELVKSLFGPERLFLEVRQVHHGRKEDAEGLRAVFAFAARHKARTVATHKVLFAKPEQAELGALHFCLGGRAKWKDYKLRIAYRKAYIRSPRQMAEDFIEHPEALRNTMVLAEMCTLKAVLPSGPQASFPISLSDSSDDDADARFAELCRVRLTKRAGTKFMKKGEENNIRARLALELAEIRQVGGAALFVLLADICEWARQKGIPVLLPTTINGSLVAYLLGLTELNPLAFGFAWERFLPRLEPLTDLQIWVGAVQHERFRELIFEKVAQNALRVVDYRKFTFTTGIFRVLEAAGLTMAQEQEIKDMVRQEADYSWNYDGWERLGILLQERKAKLMTDTDLPELLRLAAGLDGVACAAKEHLETILVSDQDLTGQIPVAFTLSVRAIAQYPQSSLAGCWPLLEIKAQSLLSRLARAEKNVRRDLQWPAFKLRDLPLADEQAFAFLQSSDAFEHFTGNEDIFCAQEICAWFREAKVGSLTDLAAVFALCRPGGIDLYPAFLAAKLGSPLKTGPGVSPRLAAFCPETFGVMVFQEQCLYAIAAMLDCYSREAEQWRRWRAKRSAPSEKAEFVARVVAKEGIKEAEAELVFVQLAHACEYSFHKGYALTWALLFYRCAYLARHYPLQYSYALEFETTQAQESNAGDEALNFHK